ncbi:recombinase family protein [Paraburkholderia mimosarum]|uniref:recombinase family protein n=1 Tax=Paraburkholderia mimosarum TaxID=312026 RepID=UPI0039C2398C
MAERKESVAGGGKGRVYSYLRFSSAQQAKGSSADRQLAYAARWAAENGYQLDDSLSMRDEGLSAFHQRHIKQGALGVFLRAVEDGRIPEGSVLVVEGLDRLSRAEPIQAQAQLAQIINAGITVVTASDGREYNRARLKAQPMDLVYSLLVMIRAHEESDTKSKRIKAAYRRHCEGWVAGTYRGLVGSTATDPVWVTYSKESGFSLVPKEAEAVTKMIELYKAGYGAIDITRKLGEQGLTVSDRYPTNRVGRLIKQRNLMGDKVVVADGQRFVLKGYYPALISEAEYDELQLLVSKREIRKGKGELPSLLTGMKITHCGYCGKLLVAQNMMKRAKGEDGRPQPGHRRLRCGSYYKLAKRCVGGDSCSVVPIELALMRYCSDQMNLDRLLAGDDKADPLARALVTARKRVAATEGKLAQISAALLADEGDAPATYLKLARELEKRLQAEQQEVERIERELAHTAQAEPSTADAWGALFEGVQALDYDARMKARQLVIDTFERIEIRMKGQYAKQSNVIHISLKSKRGVVREFEIDRRTGDLRAGSLATGQRLDAAAKPARAPAFARKKAAQ